MSLLGRDRINSVKKTDSKIFRRIYFLGNIYYVNSTKDITDCQYFLRIVTNQNSQYITHCYCLVLYALYIDTVFKILYSQIEIFYFFSNVKLNSTLIFLK